MRTIVVLAAALAPICSFATSHAGDRVPQSGIAGVLLPDGSFKPVPRRTTAAAAQASAGNQSTFYGSIVGNITLGIASDSSRLNPATITCRITSLVDDTPDGTYYYPIEESSTVAATISGNRAICHPKIIYQWSLYSPAQDTIEINIAISGVDANGIGRTSTPTPPKFVDLPPSGSTTTFDFTGRI